jgi:hypothetical protein
LKLRYPKAKQRWFFFIFGIMILWARNAPLAVILPPWSHGDEIAHFDYAMKLGRGHIPKPEDEIEPEVFHLHRDHYDAGYISFQRAMGFEKPGDLGLAGYSYEAPHPPVPYLVLAAFRLPLNSAGLPLLAQVKALRLVILLVMSAGLLVIHLTLRRRSELAPFWSAPLAFIPLLPQDMYFSINTDVFAFTAGCGVVWGIFRLFDRPSAAGRWFVLALLIAFSMWIKATGAFYFALWPILAVVLCRSASGRAARRRIAALAAIFFILAGLSAAPWYVSNAVNHSYVFGFQFNADTMLPYKSFAPPRLQWPRIKEFFHAFGNTLIRGEFLWHGAFLDGLPQPWNWIFQGIMFWIVFTAGLVAVFLPPPKTPAGLFFILAAGGAGVIVSLFVLHFGFGGIPFYHARYAFAGLYLILLIFAAGWRRLWPADGPAIALPAAILFAYNISYTAHLLSAVLSTTIF